MNAQNPFGRTPAETIDRGASGQQWRFRFDNGWGASVVRGPYTYGGPEGFFELAVLDSEGLLNYDTPVTSDVEGWLTAEAVDGLLDRIAVLEARVTA